MSTEDTSETRTARPALTQPIYLITDGGGLRQAGKLVSAVESAISGALLEGGEVSAIGMVQLREQVSGGTISPASDEELVQLVAALLPVCRRHKTKLIINRRVDLASSIGADGVHLGADTIRLMPNDRAGLIFGYSAHRPDEGLKAIEKGFDYVLFSPVFEPLSKAASRPTRGREELALFCSSATKPVYALGGITAQNARSCRVSGASGVAVITSILGQDDPGRSAAELFAAWRG